MSQISETSQTSQISQISETSQTSQTSQTGQTGQTGDVVDTARIQGVLPHRHPMLLVDGVTSIEPGSSLVAVKAVTASEPWFAGTREAGPDADFSYPTTLLIESWCQAAGILATWERPNPDVLAGDVMLFGAISGIRIGPPVFPGCVLEHHVRLVRSVAGTLMFAGRSVTQGRDVLEVGQVVMAMRPASTLTPEPV
jgi:3-hydroxyacyl-[acyl-carrier-protein] dehydratase